MNHFLTLAEVQQVCVHFLQQAESIKNQNVRQYKKDMQYATLMTELEGLGVPVLMCNVNQWLSANPGNKLLLETYRTIGNMRDL